MNATELTTLKTKVHAIARPEKQLFTYYVLTSLLSLCLFPIVLIPLYFRYHTLWYRFTDEGVSMGYGILFRREMQLTYARMQDIHLSQDILDRWLGIGTVTVQTAGAGGSGNLTIAGVREFEAIRDYLYARMRGVHSTDHSPSSDAVLIEIRDALRDAAAALSAKKGS